MMFLGRHAKVRGLDTQRRIVGHHAGWRMAGLAERRANDAVVRLVGVEAMFDQQMLLDAVDLDLQRAAGRNMDDVV